MLNRARAAPIAGGARSAGSPSPGGARPARLGEQLPVRHDDRHVGRRACGAPPGTGPSRVVSVSSSGSDSRRAASATGRRRERGSATRGAWRVRHHQDHVDVVGAGEAFERGDRPRVVAHEHRSDGRGPMGAGIAYSPSSRRRWRGSASPSSIRRSSARTALRPSSLSRSMNSVPSQVVGLMLEDPGQQPSPRDLDRVARRGSAPGT